MISLNLLHNETGGILDIESLADITYGSGIHLHIDEIKLYTATGQMLIFMFPFYLPQKLSNLQREPN